MNNVCRTCRTNNLFTTNETKHLDKKIIKMISLCVGLEVSKLDAFSNIICNTCFNKLEEAYIFRQLCWQSHGYFVKKLPVLKESEIKQELHNNEIVEHKKDEKCTNELIKIETVDPIDEKKPKSKFVKGKGKVNIRKHCYMCSKTYSKLSTLKDHLLRVHNTIYNKKLISDEVKKCSLGDDQFDTVSAPRKHMIKYIKDRKNDKVIKDTNEVNARECYLCSKSFFKRHLLKKHLLTAHKIKSNEELIPDEVKKRNLGDEKFDPVQVNRKHMIKRSTKDRKNDKVIEDKNEAKAARECYLCPESFFMLPLLKKHLLKAHKVKYNEELIPVEAKTCKICNKQVDTFEALRGHVLRHSQEKLSICHYCGKELSYKNLIQHLHIHSVNKPYVCDKCDYRTGRRNAFRIHQLTHTNVREYGCSICNKMFKRPSHLKTHMYSHTTVRPFTCRVCPKAFKTLSDCNYHMKIHDVSKYLSCSFCDKKFATSWTLKTHTKQHTGERPHKCEICGKGFIQSQCWRIHMKSNHNKIV